MLASLNAVFVTHLKGAIIYSPSKIVSLKAWVYVFLRLYATNTTICVDNIEVDVRLALKEDLGSTQTGWSCADDNQIVGVVYIVLICKKCDKPKLEKMKDEFKMQQNLDLYP